MSSGVITTALLIVVMPSGEIMENTYDILKQYREKSPSRNLVLYKEELVELGKAT